MVYRWLFGSLHQVWVFGGTMDKSDVYEVLSSGYLIFCDYLYYARDRLENSKSWTTNSGILAKAKTLYPAPCNLCLLT